MKRTIATVAALASCMALNAAAQSPSVSSATPTTTTAPAGPDEDRPTRFNETFTDKLVDQLPARAWPILKAPFFIISSLYLLLIFAGFAIHIVRHFGAI